MSDYDKAWQAATGGGGSPEYDVAFDKAKNGLSEPPKPDAGRDTSRQMDFSASRYSFATPMGRIDTPIPFDFGISSGLNALGADVGDWNAGIAKKLATFGSGLTNFAEGVKGLTASNKPQSLSDLVTGSTPDIRTRLAVDEKRATDAPLTSDTFGKVVQGLGQTAPMFAVPYGWAKGAGAVAGPIIEGIATGAASGALDPVGTGDSRAMNAGVGAIAGGTLPAAVAGGRAVLSPVSQAIADKAKRAIDLGIPLGAVDTAGNFVKSARSMFSDMPFIGGISAAQDSAKQQGFNRAVGREFGADASALTPDVMQAAKGKITDKLDALWNNNNVNVDQDLFKTIVGLENEVHTLPSSEARRLSMHLTDLKSKIQQDANGNLFIPGDVANKFQTQFKDLKGNGFLENDLLALRKGIISAFNRSVTGDEANALTAARYQYKNFKTANGALNNSELGIAGRQSGDISPALLANSVRQNFPDLATRGATNGLPELAQLGNQFLVDRVKQTGGSTRAMLQNMGVGGAALGGAAFAPAATGLGIAGGGLLNYTLGNPKIARALLNDYVPGLAGTSMQRLPIGVAGGLLNAP